MLHLDAWRRYARQARAMVRVAKMLSEGKLVPAAERGQALGWGPFKRWREAQFIAPMFRDAPPCRILDRRGLLADEVSRWLADAAVYVRFEWSDRWPHRPDAKRPGPGRAVLGLAGPEAPYAKSWSYPWPEGSLFAALAAQLAAALAAPEQQHTCDACHELYPLPVRRRARRDWRNFCSPECAQAADRERKRLWARRKRASGSPTGGPTL